MVEKYRHTDTNAFLSVIINLSKVNSVPLRYGYVGNRLLNCYTVFLTLQ